MLAKFIVAIIFNIYIYQIITLYILNLYNVLIIY